MGKDFIKQEGIGKKVVNSSTQSNIPHNKDDCEESVDTVGKHFTASSAMFGFVDTVK